MIALTGAGGFIGSVVLGYLNQQGITDIVLFDDLPTDDQYKNLVGKKYISLHSTEEIFHSPDDVECVIHIGANSNTLERDWSSLYKTNVLSTRKWNQFCIRNDIPFIFTSSAAVYGNGNGPLNQYAFSKLTSETEIDGVILRLFNVYGPNEYHKGRMASTLYHWYNQTEINLFNNSVNYIRDFIYVEDVAKVIYYFIQNYKPGTYDVGTGQGVSFDTVADIVGKSKKYIDMPNDLKSQYQTNTCADLTRLIESGFDVSSLRSVELGIPEYYKYLKTNQIY
jgi:ADP-L-glycero-D-manno-heptose 6-epimerase